jgi:tripartite-type tricarboxylate transporter receptor subunit TctC
MLHLWESLMPRTSQFSLIRCSILASLLWVGTSAMAQSWPAKPIKVIAPYPPGGPSDLVMRTAAEKIQATLKQPIVIENQPGAGGNIGAAAVARAVPDGYTFLIATDTLLTVNPHVYKSMTFKLEDLKPISVLSSFSQTLVCHPSLGVKTLAELIAKSKTVPLSYASGGAGVPGICPPNCCST